VSKRLFAAVFVFVTCASAGRPDAGDGAAAESKAVQGVWAATSAELAGQDLPAEVIKNWRLTLGDGKYVFKGAEQPDEGTVKVHPDKKPKEMEITGTNGPNKGKTFLCIYELTGDKMKVCYDLSGKSRPTEFKTKPETQLFLATYLREKK
jgi:uncharacterized protein (TIGR03067 family)